MSKCDVRIEYSDGWWNVIVNGTVVDGFMDDCDAWDYMNYIKRMNNAEV